MMETSDTASPQHDHGEQAPSKFTSGPWTAVLNPDWYPWPEAIEVHANGHCIAWMTSNARERDRDVANARLIAAAPDMLAALRLVIHDVRSGSLPTNIQKAIVSAFAKATGAA